MRSADMLMRLLFNASKSYEKPYLAQLQSIVNLVLEWSHLYLPDEFGLNTRIGHDRWEQLPKMWENLVSLVMDGRINCRHGKTVVGQLAIV